MRREEQSFRQLMEQAQKALVACHGDIADFKQSQYRLWQRWAGSDLAEMLETPHAAEGYLQHPDKYLRLAALGILVFHWSPTTVIAPTFERMAFADPDEEVRGSALVALGMCYAGTKDHRIEKLLATIVRDETQSAEFRRIAYGNLFQVRGLTVDLWPAVGTSFRFPEDVDWGFIACAES